ncbi:MAG: DsbA family protein [Polyangiaceae bacterium]|nr:DsbA family protein [Polyangiaceae bacterium]
MTRTALAPPAARLRWTALPIVVGAWTLMGTLGCGAPGQASGGSGVGSATSGLAGVDSSSLTTRERQQWADLVSELLAPCADQAMTLARCLDTKAPCRACVLAAQLLVDQIEQGRTPEQAREAYRIRYCADAVAAIALDGSPARGASHPVVTIVEWTDFQCPFCAACARALHVLADKYPDRVRVVSKQYPLSSHPNSDKAARAAIAAGLQGKFWPMHDRLFAAQASGIDPERIRRLAREIGLDEQVFARDCEGPRVQAILARDRRQADELQLDGTPFIYVNGRHFDLSLFDVSQDLENWVVQEFELAANPPAASPAHEAPARPLGAPK